MRWLWWLTWGGSEELVKVQMQIDPLPSSKTSATRATMPTRSGSTERMSLANPRSIADSHSGWIINRDPLNGTDAEA